MDSDKPSSADNQQERPTRSSWLDRIPDDLGHYVAGFVDGEGSFNVPIRRERDRTMPLRVGLSFNVSQIGRELPEILQGVFSCGTVRGRRDGVVYFEVTRPDDLQERVFPFFERYQLRGPKVSDLAVFRMITALVQSGDHLSPAGLRRIVELRSPMNRGGKRRRTDEEIGQLLEVWESSEAIRKAPW
jgi:LAGLIDADG endonuclease